MDMSHNNVDLISHQVVGEPIKLFYFKHFIESDIKFRKSAYEMLFYVLLAGLK